MSSLAVEIEALQGPKDFYAQPAESISWNVVGYELLWDTFQVHGAFLPELPGERARSLVGLSALLICPKEIIIARLGIIPEYQGKGIGSLLVEHTAGIAAQAACPTVSVQPTNLKNMLFYRNHDFLPDRTRNPYRFFRDL